MKEEHYLVKPTSEIARIDLVRFLDYRGFEFIHGADWGSMVGSPYPIIIDIGLKTAYHLTCAAFAAAAVDHLIPETEFYKEYGLYLDSRSMFKRLYDNQGNLLYEGYTLNEAPYGAGTVYYANGNKYQEGRFDIKGLLEGREYYPDGHIRFQGIFRIHDAYGPNAPVYGKFYDESGKLIYDGKFEVRSGGVGYPTVKKPESFGSIVQNGRPKYRFLQWSDC